MNFNIRFIKDYFKEALLLMNFIKKNITF